MSSHTVIEELNEVDHAEFDGQLEELLMKRSNKAHDLLETVLDFLARKTRAFKTSDGRARAHQLLAAHTGVSAAAPAAAAGKKGEAASAGLQTGFFGKSAAVASPASRRSTPQEAQAQAATSEAHAEELLRQVVPDHNPQQQEAAAPSSAPAAAAAAPAAAVAAGPSLPAAAAGAPASDGVDEEEEPAAEPKGLKPTPGNGADYGRYSFTQTLAEVSVRFPVPKGTKGKQCDVSITRTKLRVGLKGEEKPILEGELHAAVRPDECAWTLEDGCLIEVTLAKADRMAWWRCVVTGEPEIDVQQVEPENSKLGDLDGETRATVEKMMYDQRQKQMGLPTSEEEQRQQMLKKFMEQHPEMDFSNAKIM